MSLSSMLSSRGEWTRARNALRERLTSPGVLPDRELTKRRLLTFQLCYWFAQPAELSAVSCAVNGWRCVGVQTLQCEGCSRRLVCRIDERLEDEQRAELGRQFEAELYSRHRASCPYLNGAVLKTRLLCLDVASIRDTFWARKESLSTRRLPEKLIVPPECQTLCHEDVLAICGWQCDGEELHCELCGQRPSVVGRKRQLSTQGDDDVRTIKRQRRQTVFKIGKIETSQTSFGPGKDMFGRVSDPAIAIARNSGVWEETIRESVESDKFDPLKQHRFFCPWIKPERVEDELCGWRRCLQVVLPSIEEPIESEQEYPELFHAGTTVHRRISSADQTCLETLRSVKRLFSKSSL